MSEFFEINGEKRTQMAEAIVEALTQIHGKGWVDERRKEVNHQIYLEDCITEAPERSKYYKSFGKSHAVVSSLCGIASGALFYFGDNTPTAIMGTAVALPAVFFGWLSFDAFRDYFWYNNHIEGLKQEFEEKGYEWGMTKYRDRM